jgi:hypothetical protein
VAANTDVSTLLQPLNTISYRSQARKHSRPHRREMGDFLHSSTWGKGLPAHSDMLATLQALISLHSVLFSCKVGFLQQTNSQLNQSVLNALVSEQISTIQGHH